MQQMQNMPQQQHTGGMATPSSHPPVPMEHPPVNPFSAGTMAAIKSAKQSLGMDADEKRKAMGLAMLHFGSNMANPNIGQGGPLGAVAQSILPAVHAYQGEANRVQDTNAALAQYMQQAQMQQQMLQYRALKEKEMMEHRERELEERSRHNKEMEALRGERSQMTPYQSEMLKLRQKEVGDKEVPAMTEEGHDLSEYSPLDGKKAFNDMRTIKTNSGDTLRELDHINKLMDEFTKLTKDNKTDPFSPYASKITNSVKDLAAYYGDSKKENVQKLKKERDLRRRLFSAIEYFNVKTEQKAKKGNLGEGMVKYFEKKKILPNTDEGKDVLLGKLKDLRQEINNSHESAKLSLKYKRHIDPSEVPAFMGMTRGIKKEASPMEAPVEAAETPQVSPEQQKAAIQAQIEAVKNKIMQLESSR
jgi:hypothetical protein